MCGFCGVVLPAGREVDRDALERMTRSLAHRGPDGEGLHIHGEVGLGHRRLSIIDLEGGRQPVTNEDGSVVVVYNGEIYNYRELTRELEAAGHEFSTESDSEVLVHLYEEHGIDGMLPKLRGMFAFALHDLRTGKVFVVRDRFGIKPAYLWEEDGRVHFASEIRAFFEVGYEPSVHRPALHLYFVTRFAHGDDTLFRGVRRLPEGTYVEIDGGRTRTVTWYPNPVHGQVTPETDPEARMDELLADAVRSHMVADVPVGCYLSGGIDSTAIAAEMIRHAGYPVRTFCVDFEGGGEGEQAERTAKGLGTEHHSLMLGVDDLLDLPSVVVSLEEPVGDAIVVAQHRLSRATRDSGTKTVLTGDGADETLGGYPFVRAAAKALRLGRALPGPALTCLAQLTRALPLFVVDQLANLPFGAAREARTRMSAAISAAGRGDVRELFDILTAVQLPRELDEIYTPEFAREVRQFGSESFAGEPSGRTALQRALSVQYRKWLPANINTKQDRLCMAHSIENRVPFLDHHFVEAMVRMPDAQKVVGGRNKVLLRDWAIRHGHDRYASSQKVPFHIPLERYVEDPRVWRLVEEHTNDSRVAELGFFRPEYVRRLAETARAGDYLAAKRLFGLVIASIWHDRFIENPVATRAASLERTLR